MSATLQVQEKTTLLPFVPHSQYGPAQQYCLREIFNTNGQLVWQKSPRGFISFFDYDPASGTLRQKIEDVDLSSMSTPPPWDGCKSRAADCTW
jgi:hypothetical protein